MPSPNSLFTSSSTIDQLARSLHHQQVVIVPMNLPSSDNAVRLSEDTTKEGEINDGFDPQTIFYDVDLDAYLDFDLPLSLQHLVKPSTELLQEGTITEFVPLSSSGMATMYFCG